MIKVCVGYGIFSVEVKSMQNLGFLSMDFMKVGNMKSVLSMKISLLNIFFIVKYVPYYGGIFLNQSYGPRDFSGLS